MPFAGLGLHLVFAILFAIHAVRTRQPMYWLLILLVFPLFGSLVYFLAVYLPNSRLERGAMKVVASAVKAIDPKREVRDARAALEESPTAQNQMRLASALLEAGDAAAAATEYEKCLRGPFASDGEIRFGAAKAFVECNRFAEAIRYLEPLRQEQPNFRPEAISILTARALAGTARHEEARQEFDSAVTKFGSYAALAEYAIWSYTIGDKANAERLVPELEKVASRWNSLSRELNEPVARRLAAARILAAKPV